jgi:hypothetical protein
VTQQTQEWIEQLDWAEVESSQIKRVAWLSWDEWCMLPGDYTSPQWREGPDVLRDGADSLLFVEFHTKRAELGPSVYCYLNVPQGVHTDLLGADSAGRFLSTAIKSSFRVLKVEFGASEDA